MSAAYRTGMSFEQRNARTKHQLAVSRQELDLARNQLRQAQLQAASLKQGEVVAKRDAAKVLKLKARVSQMGARLAAKSRQLKRLKLASLTASEPLFGTPGAKRYPAEHAHRGF